MSWYSYIAFVELLANREKLAAHGVEIEYAYPLALLGLPRRLSHLTAVLDSIPSS